MTGFDIGGFSVTAGGCSGSGVFATPEGTFSGRSFGAEAFGIFVVARRTQTIFEPFFEQRNILESLLNVFYL